MPFIGNKPTAVPLTSADIQDGTIQAVDLASGVVSPVYGLFRKIDPTVVAWDKTGAFTMETTQDYTLKLMVMLKL